MAIASSFAAQSLPAPRSILELLKPVTWFPPMWAYLCGFVSTGMPLGGLWFDLFLGILLTGPLVCATSQAVNDWYDRDVDAINEPNRPIPSGRIPGRWGLYIGLFWTWMSALVAAFLGPEVFIAAVVGLALAWMYSAPPARLKQNGWWGNAAVATCYEGLPWVTGAAVMLSGAMPPGPILVIAALYSLGAHGIMTLNDFKSIKGDTELGLLSLPVQLGAHRAANFACLVMAGAQVVVVCLLFFWQQPLFAIAIMVSIGAQLVCMRRLLTDPERFAPWYNATGVSLYVTGMLISAIALRSVI